VHRSSARPWRLQSWPPGATTASIVAPRRSDPSSPWHPSALDVAAVAGQDTCPEETPMMARCVRRVDGSRLQQVGPASGSRLPQGRARVGPASENGSLCYGDGAPGRGDCPRRPLMLASLGQADGAQAVHRPARRRHAGDHGLEVGAGGRGARIVDDINRLISLDVVSPETGATASTMTRNIVRSRGERHTVPVMLRAFMGGCLTDTSPPACCQVGGTLRDAATSNGRELTVLASSDSSRARRAAPPS
jgi:hypothetical protein